MYSQINFTAGSNFYLNLYCFILYCFLLLISLRGNVGAINRDHSKIRTIMLFCGITWFALTSFINDDFFHYYEIMGDYKRGVMDSEFIGLEMPYQYIIYYFGGNYFLFRLIVWGGSLLLIALSARAFGVSAYNTMFLVLAGFIIIFSYARATLAMSIFALGAVTISLASEQRRAMLKKLIGIGIMALSIYFHRSMLPMVIIAVPLLLLPYKRDFTRLSLYLFPIMVLGCSLLLREALGELTLLANSTMDDESGILKKMEYYAEDKGVESNLNGYIALTLKYATFYVPLLLIAISLRSKKVITTLDNRCIWLYLITYLMIVIATSMLFIGFDSDVLFYRYLFMSFVPLCILISYMRQNNILSVKSYNFIIICFIISNLLQLFTLVYAS